MLTYEQHKKQASAATFFKTQRNRIYFINNVYRKLLIEVYLSIKLAQSQTQLDTLCFSITHKLKVFFYMILAIIKYIFLLYFTAIIEVYTLILN